MFVMLEIPTYANSINECILESILKYFTDEQPRGTQHTGHSSFRANANGNGNNTDPRLLHLLHKITITT